METRPGLLGTPLGQFGLGAVALVVGGALLFSLIGAVSDADPDDAVAQPSPTATTTEPSPSPTDDGTTTDAPTDEPTDEPTETPTTDPETPAIDPGSVTIQVLDGTDDPADHEAVVACLRAAGYDSLITSNRARSTYAATTVFWATGDDQDAAVQVAAALGTADAEEQPGNLSDSVPVHVVSGQDGSDLC